MGNRIIKESILTSETVGALDDFSFRLFVSLIVLADDYGRGKSNPAIIRGQAFPLCDITPGDVENGLQTLSRVGAIGLYVVDGTRYFYFPKWEKHQTIRNKKSKFPPPNENDCERIENNCKQLQANARNCVSESNTIQYNPIQYESKVNKNSVPTREQVKTEIIEKGYKTDADKFFDYYSATGWKIKGQPIEDWKALLRCWAKADEAKPKKDGHFDGVGSAEKEWAEKAAKKYG